MYSPRVDENLEQPKPFCECWMKRAPARWVQMAPCTCGEEVHVSQWNWESPQVHGLNWALVTCDKRQVTFHPSYSSGTALVRGDTPLVPNYHYYWEVKMLTDTYGTDIMVGVGSEKINMTDSQFKFISLLGQDSESYGLSYTGAVRHAATIARECPGFCRGTIIGVRLDLWQGTLEFYLNRESQGIAFYNLRRHRVLYPMISSTAAQSTMRLIYATSWCASLLVDAVKILAASSKKKLELPPGLQKRFRSHFWLTMPKNGNPVEEDELGMAASCKMPSEIMPTPLLNGFYVDSVERNFRVVVWE